MTAGSSTSVLALRSIENAVAGMTRNDNDVEAQEAGCDTLARLVDDADDKAKVRAAIANHGGVAAIVAALTKHCNDFRMPEAGCGALAKIAEGNSHEAREVLAEKGGVDAVIRAMSLYPGEMKVQLAGCSILASVADKSSERREIVASKGGAQAVMLAMVNHEDVRPVGLRLLLVLDRPEIDSARDAIRKEKGADRVDKALDEIRQELATAGGARMR
eukprot:CAMPEP_0169335340 /NCGR_PEP_ID=MMETSP1017-20121227/16273_1 /TAXON_ID=342587 /ORGANISM="Karlodinium micrum, Strain CCMP2283" /LENGTH=216 /DNA_ID=CAMNT_0009430687 /DNA_START=41 /DNA_END=688 /DNA_ORIENTATION=-